MMEENYVNEELEEILENSVPEELDQYLEADELALGQIDGVLNELESRINSLNEQREASEKSFEDRLEEFKAMIEKEKQDTFDDFERQEKEINEEKSRIEEIKLDQQSKQVNYVDALKGISESYNSKINSIQEAIDACEDNTILTQALQEEQEKLLSALEGEYENRKHELDSALEEVGFEKEPEIDPNQEINLDFRTPEEIERDKKKQEELLNREINLDFRTPEEIERDKKKQEELLNREINLDFRTPEEIERDKKKQEELLNREINLDFRTPEEIERDLLKELESRKVTVDNNFNLLNEENDNEVVEFESREDVINEIYQSKDVMEGHVFPYLKSIME